MDATGESLVLIDADDREIGTAEKIDAHRRGLLHRAFSVIVWDSSGRQLLQKRAATKYHSGGLWTNACCGHPRPGETAAAAAARRLAEEMGFVGAVAVIGLMGIVIWRCVRAARLAARSAPPGSAPATSKLAAPNSIDGVARGR